MGTDFFDEDLVREREAALKIKLDGDGGGSPRDGFIPSSRDLPNRPVSELTLTHLGRHKQEVTDQMVDKTQELDRLRARQEELEKERRTLEEMRKKQESFDVGRREIKERLGASLIRMEKDRLQAERLTQLLEETRRMFRERLDEVEALNETEWEDEHLIEELNKSLLVLENARADYNKAMAKIEAIHPQAPVGAAAAPRGLTFEDAPSVVAEGAQGFGYWLRAGLAFTLPLLAWLTVLALVWMTFTYFWG
jgi:vacuolar-type H+-ATPase subunit I/STV1